MAQDSMVKVKAAVRVLSLLMEVKGEQIMMMLLLHVWLV